MTALKTLFRRTKTLLWTAFSILVILAAVLVGIGKLMMPFSDRYQPQLEAWLSEEFGRPIELESFRGEWTAFGPRLSLQGMKLMPPGYAVPDAPDILEEEVAIVSAALDIKPLNALIPGRPLYNFRVSGADFELRHTTDGRLELSGFGVTDRGDETQGSALADLARVGEVILEDSNLVYQDERYGILLGFTDIQGALSLDGEKLSTEIQASFHDTRSGMVYGDVEATVLLTVDDEQRLVHARGIPGQTAEEPVPPDDRVVEFRTVGRVVPAGRPPGQGCGGPERGTAGERLPGPATRPGQFPLAVAFHDQGQVESRPGGFHV
jgi:hypothetical protein